MAGTPGGQGRRRGPPRKGMRRRPRARAIAAVLAPRKGQPIRPLTALRRDLRDAHVTLTEVAAAAKVRLPAVSRAFSGHIISSNIVAAAERLIARHNGASRKESPS